MLPFHKQHLQLLLSENPHTVSQIYFVQAASVATIILCIIALTKLIHSGREVLCSCVDLFTQVNFRKQKLENTNEDIELKIVKRPTSHRNPTVLEEIHVNEEQYTPRTASKQLNSAAAQTNIRLIEKVSPKGAELC
jgi:hypothetical protein